MGGAASTNNNLPKELDATLCKSLLGDKYDEKIFKSMQLSGAISQERYFDIITDYELKLSARELLQNAKGCVIDLTEHRGITIRQLMTVMVEIEDRCIKESWEGVRFNAITQEWSSVPLTPELVNLYDVAEKVIKPRTEDRQCSYVEIIAEELYYNSRFKATGLTDGLIPSDNNYAFVKQTRDFDFPVDRIHKASLFDFRSAQATALIDAKHIKNTIAKKNIDDIPDDDHPNYVKLNNILRGRFVAPLWSRLLKRGYDMEPYYPILKNSEIKKLDSLAFERLPQFTDDVASRFVENFPTTVQCIDIDLHDSINIGEVEMKALFRLPSIVEHLSDFSVTGGVHASLAIETLCDNLRANAELSCHDLKSLRIVDSNLTPENIIMIAELLSDTTLFPLLKILTLSNDDISQDKSLKKILKKWNQKDD
eukprot:gene8283-11212_t